MGFKFMMPCLYVDADFAMGNCRKTLYMATVLYGETEELHRFAALHPFISIPLWLHLN